MTTRNLLILTFLLTGAPTGALAMTPGGLQWYYFSPRQMAMGFTGIALTDDPVTAAMNPGAMAFSRTSGVQAGSSMLRPATTFLEAFPSTYLDTTSIPTLTPLYMNAVIHPGKNNKLQGLTLGLAVNQPFGVSVAWPDLWKGKFISQEFTLNTYFLHVSAGIRINDRWGIGVGGSYGALTLLSRRAIRDTDGLNLNIGSVAMSGEDLTWGLFCGVFFKASEDLRLSLMLRSPMHIRILHGRADFSVPESLESAYPDQEFTTSFWLPPSMDFGLQYRPKPRLTLCLAGNLTGWSMLDSLSLDLEKPVSSLTQYPERKLHNALSLRMGGELSLNERWTARAGLYLENTPVPEEFLSPEFPDASRIGVTTGTGVRIGSRIQIDLAYQFAFTGERSGTLAAARFGGTYESLLHGLSAGIGYFW